MKKFGLAVLLLVSLAGDLFAQTGNASLGGGVEDRSKALIPGVRVTAKNVATGIAATQITNESGIYNFPSLLPGTYEISAELPGFKKSIQRTELPYAGQVRVNFTLEVGDATAIVDVIISTESVLKDSSASVGDVLPQSKIQSLPLVGNNVLDLLETLPGLRTSAINDSFDTVNGLGLDTINVTRDGLSINDGRYAAGSTTGGAAIGGKGRYLLSDTTLLPDLVGEIRLILSPVDAELGRGNSQIQISTRSGTNRYTGSAAWYVRNTALDANTWENNHTPFSDPATGVTTNSTQKPWTNNHQYSLSYGGPVQIPGVYDGHNKTFFYTLWSQNISNTRQVIYTPVLTDTARLGIFRYYPFWAPAGFNANATVRNQQPGVPVTTSPTWIAVDTAGNPVPPPAMPNGSPYTSLLTCFSVFGNMRLDTNGNMVPFTDLDCPGGNAVFPQSAPSLNGNWDRFRPAGDTTGYIKKLLSQMPHANFFAALDGLNLAQYSYMQRRGGSTGANAQQITDPNANSKQINIRIDHNFSTNHKAAFNYTYQRDNSDANVSSWPDGPFGSTSRRPHVFTANLTSTLSPSLVNEARFGVNRNWNSTLPAYLNGDGGLGKDGEPYLIPGGQSVLNPDYSYLVTLGSSNGRVGSATGPLNVGLTSWTNSILYSFGDTLSWSRGKHAFKFGAERRLPRNAGNGGANQFPGITLGNNQNATQTIGPFSTSTNFPELTGLVSTSVVNFGNAPNNPRNDVNSLLYFLNGSVSQASQFYFIRNFTNIDQNRWDDYSNAGIRMKTQVHGEWAAFVKDDYKISRHLTLNLGVRWEFYASPFIRGGLTSTIIGSGYGAFGATRTAQAASLEEFDKDPFRYWLQPGSLFLTGYGNNPFQSGQLPLDCVTGTKQNAFLPTSTCDANSLSSIQFVGPDSPNPKVKAIPEYYGNFGPAIGFAWDVPWFGEGKTTVRGGYQQTFQRILVNNSGEANGTDTFIGQIPGSQQNANTSVLDPAFQSIINPTSGIGRALNLTDVPILVPVRPAGNPGGVIPLGVRNQGIQGIYDSKYKSPYTQNLTLSVTRLINRIFTVDVRYTGTLGRKLDTGTNLNTPNVYHNPELLQALLDARAGTCTAGATAYKANYTDQGISPCDINGDPVLLDQMLAGLNPNNTLSTFGNVGTVVNNVFQTGAQHLRRSGTFQQNLANGDLNAVANSLLGLNPNGLQALPTNPTTGLGYFTTTDHPAPGMRTLRNGCDRLGSGFTIVQQNTVGGAQLANTGTAIPLRCFPEDYLITNSQFTNVTYRTNWNNSYYHAMQAQVTMRPTNGVSLQSTWVWSKTMGNQGTYIDPVNRRLNYYAQTSSPHALRMNGTVELPIGPNKLLFRDASGWFARAIERWQTSFIFNASSATRTSATPGVSHFYGNPGFVIASTNWALPNPNLEWSGNTGSLYGNAYTSAPDPQCADASQVGGADRMGTNLQSACTIVALAARNPDGTPGEVLLKYAKPGEVGTLGFGNFKTFGNWTLDMSASKTFNISESKSVQIRIDSTNVLNHPTPTAPSFSANSFGVSNNKDGERSLQGQLRFMF